MGNKRAETAQFVTISIRTLSRFIYGFDTIMMVLKVVLICAVVLWPFGLADNCQNPQLISKFYSTQDATVLSNIAFISEFNVKCQKGQSGNLYALFSNDVIVPISTVGPSKYQLSWTEELKAAKTGDITVKIFDENGYSAIRKALRNGEDISSVPPFSSITVNHTGTYIGPWISCEFLAVVISLAVAYYAISFRSKLIS